MPVLGATIVLACLAPGAWPDSVDMAQAQGGGFALDAARSFFTYVPSLGLNGRRSWTEGQLSEIQGWSARIRRAGTRGLLAINVLEERRSPQPSSAEVGPFGTREIVDSTAAGEAGRREAEFGLSLSLDMLGLEEQSKEPLSLEGVPEVALLMADYLIDFADSAYYLAANLRRLLGQDPGVDLELLFRNRPHLRGGQMESKSRKGPAEARKQARRTKNINVKKVVRSVFKILLGIAIGLILWMVVRKL